MGLVAVFVMRLHQKFRFYPAFIKGWRDRLHKAFRHYHDDSEQTFRKASGIISVTVHRLRL